MTASFLLFGTNRNNEFEIKDEEKMVVKEEEKTASKQISLKPLNLHKINQIYMGNNYCICTDGNQHFWAAGNNKNGQCAVNKSDQMINFTRIDYFETNKIEIKNVYVNTSGNCTFWLTVDDELYGNGWNKHMQLGLPTSYGSKIITPILIRSAPKHIVDIKSAFNYTLILLANGQVCSTPFSKYGGNGHQRPKFRKAFGFKRVRFSGCLRIVKIAAGYYHSLFLSDNARVWSCGKNNYGQLGLGHNNTIKTPTLISFSCRIADICCGGNHNIAKAIIYGRGIGYYSWGANKLGQCGVGITDDINTPRFIQSKTIHKIMSIKCGRNHTYIHCNVGTEYTPINQHYLFGNNCSNQCVVSKEKLLNNPVLIEHDNPICNIFLGYEKTIMMVTKIYDNSKPTEDDEKKEDSLNKIKMKPIWEYKTSEDVWKEYDNEMHTIIESLKLQETHKFTTDNGTQQIYKTTEASAIHIDMSTGKITEIRRTMKYEDQLFDNTAKCSYYNIANRLLEQHFPSIPKESFNNTGNMCYCSDCHEARGDATIYTRGIPPKKYGLPIGFARFGLKVDDGFCKMHQVFDNFHVCYHGTDKNIVPQIFHGRLTLLRPGDVAIGGNPVGIRNGHIKTACWRENKFTRQKEFFDPNQIYISPSIKYSAHRVYAKWITCKHPLDNNIDIKVQFAFQCRIRPGSYKIGQETVGATRNGVRLDENFPNNGIEWYTKENIAIIVHGLLLRFKET